MKLLDFINDPLHAFFALVGTVILSMFGAFIKDGLLYLFGRSSKYLKHKRDEDIRKRDLIVESLVNSQPYMVLYCTRTILSNISIAVMFILILTIPSIVSMADFNTAALALNKNNILASDTSKTLGQIFKFLFLIFTLVISMVALALTYSVSKRNLIIALATKMIQENLKYEACVQSAEPATMANSDEKDKSTNTISTEHYPSPAAVKNESGQKVNKSEDNSLVFTKTIVKNGKIYTAKEGRLFTIRKN